MTPSLLPACECEKKILYYDADVHRCLVCFNYTLGEYFGKPIEKFKGSYDDGTAKESSRTDT